MYIKYKDASLPVNERVEDLMARMSIRQKIDQITCLVTIQKDIPDFSKIIPDGIGHVGAFSVAENVEEIAEYSYRLQKHLTENTELGIPALIHCEAISGGQFTGATVFPSAIGQASTWEPELISEMTEVIREQMYAVGFRHALSPVADITRDPRWGRVTETYGEDPTLAAAMGSAFVRGLQGDDETKGIAATGKHFVGHGNAEGGLNMAQSVIPERELREVHAKPFQAMISEANLMSVMCSYSSINREPVAGSKRILTGLLRDEMGFNGIVVSDYIAIDRLVSPFCVAENYTDAGIRALNAGLDVEYPRPKGYTYQLEEYIKEGKLDIAILDRAVRRVLEIKFRLGLFENPFPQMDRLNQIFGSGMGHDLSLRMAKKIITLLKNENNVLPLSKDIKKIAILGPHGNSLRSFFATFSYPAVLDMTMSREEDGQEFDEPGLIVYNIKQRYPGDIREITPRVEKEIRKAFPGMKTLYEAIKEYLPGSEVKYSPGVSATGYNIADMDHALNVAAEADVIILTLGGKNGWGNTSTVGEGIDSTSIDLPGLQEKFARKVRALGKKTVVVHFDGRPLSNEYVATHFDAIIEAWQCGQFGADALTSVLFGDYNPAGRLAITAPRNVGQIPVYYGMPRGSGYISAGCKGMIVNPNGYINDVAEPLYHFGHGLSYTEFSYDKISVLKKEVGPEEEVEVSVWVTNCGNMDGDEVIQLYASDVVSSMVRSDKELVGFKRVFIKAGKTIKVTFTFKVSQLAFLDEDMNWKVEKGKIVLLAGASSKDIRLKDEFYITYDAVVDPKTRGFYARARVD